MMLDSRSISEESIPLAAEDRFLIFGIRDAARLCPSESDAEQLGWTLSRLSGHFIPVFDIRGLPELYHDVEAFIISMAKAFQAIHPPHFLLDTRNQLLTASLKRCLKNPAILNVKGKPHSTRPLLLSDLAGGSWVPSILGYNHWSPPLEILASYLLQTLPLRYKGEQNFSFDGLKINPLSLQEISEAWKDDILREEFSSIQFNGVSTYSVERVFQRMISTDPPYYMEKITNSIELENSIADLLRMALVEAFVSEIHSHSLLVEFAIAAKGDQIECIHYHSGAIHNVEMPNSPDLLVGRPAVLARRTGAVLAEEISTLRRLLNKERLREIEIQRFLESHPNFLRGLNYKSIYPRLILQRDDGTQLIPDFILEPAEDEWCDILEIKLPSQGIVVGRGDRARLAAGIHEAAAQLREYAAYFESPKYRKWVREKYGLKLYRPRLLTLVGRDIRAMNSEEIRRALTAYHGLEVITFDRLLRHAHDHLLI